MVASLFSELIHFLSATVLWCTVAQFADSTFSIVKTNFMVSSPVRYAGVAGEETIVVSHGRKWPPSPARDDQFYEDEFYREIARLKPDGTDTRLRIPRPLSRFTVTTTMQQPRGTDGFVVVDDDWWYATLGARGDTPTITFVKSDGSRTTHDRPPTVRHNPWWLVPIRGQKPRALEIISAGEASIIRELDWSGERRSWSLPQARFLRPSLTAELLPDGRIALFSIESGLSMYVLSDEGRVDTIVLRNMRMRQFDTAIDDAGRIAIAAAREDGAAIEAVVADSADLEKADWYSLSHDAVVMGNLRELQVVATKTGFVAAWINEHNGKRRLEATELGPRGRGTVVEVGQPLSRGPEVFFDMQPKQDALLFWWDDGERLVQRRLPPSLTGYAFMRDLTQRFCTAEAHSD